MGEFATKITNKEDYYCSFISDIGFT